MHASVPAAPLLQWVWCYFDNWESVHIHFAAKGWQEILCDSHPKWMAANPSGNETDNAAPHELIVLGLVCTVAAAWRRILENHQYLAHSCWWSLSVTANFRSFWWACAAPRCETVRCQFGLMLSPPGRTWVEGMQLHLSVSPLAATCLQLMVFTAIVTLHSCCL